MYGMRRMEGSQWVAEQGFFFFGHSFESPIAISFGRVMVALVGPGVGLQYGLSGPFLFRGRR